MIQFEPMERSPRKQKKAPSRRGQPIPHTPQQNQVETPFKSRSSRREEASKSFRKANFKPSFHKPVSKQTPTASVPGPSPIPTKAPGEYPMRINKYLAWKGYSTRRDADKMVEKKQVTINGRFAVLGDKVNETDAVEVRSSKKPQEFVYYAYHKPRGISTEPNRKGAPSVVASIPLKGVFPVGGLDARAEGLIILTNDRRIIDRLLNPAHAHLKEYLIRTVGPLRANFKEKIEAGVTIRGETVHGSVKLLGEDLFILGLTDSGKHIREMCSMFGAEVRSLARTRIMDIELGKLPQNGYRAIEGEELEGFLKSLGL